MVGLTREQRAERNAAARQEAKQGQEFGGTAYADIQAQVDTLNEMDERAPDRRPATVVDQQTQEAAPDNRQFAGEGEEIHLLRSYQPEEGPKRQAGEVFRLPAREARRLANIGAAKFTDA
jgi:hypothetical protein